MFFWNTDKKPTSADIRSGEHNRNLDFAKDLADIHLRSVEFKREAIAGLHRKADQVHKAYDELESEIEALIARF